MQSYIVYIMRVEDHKQFLEAKVELHHLVPPVVEQRDLNTKGLLSMALHGVQLTEGPKMRCDLSTMELVPPVAEVGVVP